MPTIRYREPLNVLVVAKGHPYLRDPFMAMFDTLEGMACTLVEQPAAQGLMNVASMRGFDVLVLYDMPGLDFKVSDPPGFVDPTPEFKNGFLALLDSGIGVVALHHAIAGWPAWEEYAQLLGGRFLYKADKLLGTSRLDSGYRHEVTHTVTAADEDHPILQGIEFPLTLRDELYLFEVFEDLVEPLLRSDYSFDRQNFYSAQLAVKGHMFDNKAWNHAPGSNLVGWTKKARRSPLCYLQPGDGPETYGNPQYQRLVENSIRWVASAAARKWAQDGVATKKTK